MNIRQGLIRIWVVLSVLLLIPHCITSYQNWDRANHVYEVEVEKHRFNVSGTIMGLPELERNWVIHRIAWLKGISPAVIPKAEYGMFADLIPDIPTWQQPLSPKLEALAQGEQPKSWLPPWEDIWPLLAVIAILWAALFTGFWIVSGFQSRPAR